MKQNNTAPVVIITIGHADKGGWWYAIDAAGTFEDGYVSHTYALIAAKAAAGAAPWEIWYRCEADGTDVSIPGPRSDNHPEVVR